MKKALIFILFLFYFYLGAVYAQEDKDEAKPTPTMAISDKIQELKEKVASRVAALKKEKLTAILGSVKSVSETVLLLNSKDNEYSIQIDEETRVYSVDERLRKEEIKLSSLKKEAKVSVVGEIDLEKKTGTAKVIVNRIDNLAIVGRVGSVSTKDGTVTVIDNDGKTYIVDVEVTTKSNLYDFAKNTLVKTGLSKIEEGVRIHVYGVAGSQENRMTANRILLLPKELPSFLFVLPSPTEAPTASPSPTASL